MSNRATYERRTTSMVPILMWLLGVPVGLIIILLLLGVVNF